MIDIEIEHKLKIRFKNTRERTERFTKKLNPEDCVPQPVVYASPAKWHLGHSTWFFEEFVLKRYKTSYKIFDPQFSFLFNSYYQSVGQMVFRADRGNITRPDLNQVYQYRDYVNKEVLDLLETENLTDEFYRVLELGINHEEQHQELLFTDVKYVLGNNPIFPAYDAHNLISDHAKDIYWIEMEEGVYPIGHQKNEFCYDNELNPHKTYIQDFAIRSELVSNEEYLEFIEDKAYNKFDLWLDEGWSWVKESSISAPMYWHKINDDWHYYTFNGLQKVDPKAILCHISFYEADAFARWKGLRLATEFEWEVASDHFEWGKRWEWTNSAYLPYPGFKTAKGALGEYNGKFMINQMVLRGASVATAKGHSRYTYRNFFHPHYQWQFSGIRLAQ